jgi:regulator of sirC expression with transglutaminase-like and TPR domain
MSWDLRIPIDGRVWTEQDERVRRDFAHLVARIDGASLTRLALQVAVSEYRELIVEAIVARLEELAAAIRPKLPEKPRPLETLTAINEHLFGALRFWGDQNEPDNPQNCYLNDVLKRRAGLPLTLSVLYADVAERLGTPVQLVGIPALVLVRRRLSPVEDVFVDVYHGGQLLGHAELADLVRRMTGGRYEWGATRPEELDNRGVVTGLLTDLKGAYARRADLRRALRVQNYLLTLAPDAHRELRDRASVWERLGRPRDALLDLREYLAREPEAFDRERIEEKIAALSAVPAPAE